jgi:hypothetical protein
MDQHQVKNIVEDFSSEGNLNYEDKNELKRSSNGATMINTNQKLTSNETVSQSWPVFTAMLTFFSIFFFIFAFALRKGNNLLIPLAFLFQGWAFLLTPTVLIRQNEKLKKFVVNYLKAFKNDVYKCCKLERFPNKVYPYDVRV